MARKPKTLRTNPSEVYLHCGKCIDERPSGTSPREWAQVEVGITPEERLCVWCKRHDMLICMLDLHAEEEKRVRRH